MAIAHQSPNLLVLNYEDTKITRPMPFDGALRLRYAGPLGQHSFAGDQVHALRSARRLEIRVTLDNVSRFNTITLTVYVPDMRLDGGGDELTFRTIGIPVHAAAQDRRLDGGGGDVRGARRRRARQAHPGSLVRTGTAPVGPRSAHVDGHPHARRVDRADEQ